MNYSLNLEFNPNWWFGKPFLHSHWPSRNYIVGILPHHQHTKTAKIFSTRSWGAFKLNGTPYIVLHCYVQCDKEDK